MNSQDSFLRLARIMCTCFRLFGLNGFIFPQKRGKGEKIHITNRSIILLIFQIILLILLMTINFFAHTNKRPTVALSTINILVVRLMTCIGLTMLLTNICMDIRNRSRIWFIVGGICDFDIVVSNLTKWFNL